MKNFILIILLLCSKTGFTQVFDRFEYFFTTDPGFGNAITLTVSDGPDSVLTGNITVPVNTTSGFHFLCIRAKTPDGANNLTNRWSVAYSKPIIINGGGSGNGNSFTITDVEYFFDNDPGIGQASRTAVSPNGSDLATPTFSTNGVIPGYHIMGVRARTGSGQWSVTRTYPIIIFPGVNTASTSASQISHIEYFWGNDPGFGAATNVSVTLTNESAVVPLTVPNNIQPGFYLLGVRARTGVAGWSITKIHPFVVWSSTVNPGTQTGGNIVRMEYFIDTDPGLGNGTTLVYTPSPGQDVTSSSGLDLGVLPLGNHTFNVRALDSYGQWSTLRTSPFSISCQSGVKLFTAQSGSWNDLSTWACGRIPQPTEDVYIKSAHKVTINLGQTGQCKTIENGPGAVLDVKPGAILKVN
jgi:hypothetical protein